MIGQYSNDLIIYDMGVLLGALYVYISDTPTKERKKIKGILFNFSLKISVI